MLETLFLDYANYSLREDPESLYTFFKEILSPANAEFQWEQDARLVLEELVRGIVYLAKDDNLKRPRKDADFKRIYSWHQSVYPKVEKDPKLKEIGRRLGGGIPLASFITGTIFDAVYGKHPVNAPSPDDCALYCDDCYPNLFRANERLRRKGLVGNEKLPCYECNQVVYVYHLSELAKRKNLSRKIGFVIKEEQGASTFELLYLRNAFKHTARRLHLPRDGALSSIDYLTLDGLLRDSPITLFSRITNDLVGYSLSTFLLKGDLKKLNQCEECGKFYISKKAGPRRFCSRKCKDEFHGRVKKKTGYMTGYMRDYRER